MKKEILTVSSNEELVSGVYKMILKGDISAVTVPGQFVDISLTGFSLRRPISVCDVNGDELTLIYKTVGEGTRFMSGLRKGTRLDILLGLGNGYNINATKESALLIGGGVGVPPLYWLAKKLLEAKKKVNVIMGFKNEKEIFFDKEFESIGAKVTIATGDGSRGIKGYVTDAMPNMNYDYFYTCGPVPMLKSVEKLAVSQGQLSMEERMGCGFGACLGCSINTVNGAKRVCKEGPVFEKGEIIW